MGPVPTGVGGTDPSGVSWPVVRFRLYLVTLLLPKLATYTKFFEGCTSTAFGCSVVPVVGMVRVVIAFVESCLKPNILWEFWPTTYMNRTGADEEEFVAPPP